MPYPVYTNRGGARTSTIFSGIIAGPSIAAAPGAIAAGSDVILNSGPGRINSISYLGGYVLSGQLNSGIACQLYDGAAGTSGGPFPLSGHRLLFTIAGAGSGLFVTAPTTGANLSGQTWPNGPQIVDLPFTSGLNISCRSGMPGVTIAFSRETPAMTNNF